MANELNIILDPVDQTGLTVTANVTSAGGASIASVALTEVATPAYYVGDLDLSIIADGTYAVQAIDDTSGYMLGNGLLHVLDGAEVSESTIQKNDDANKDSITTDISNLNDFDPAVDVVARVTLVDTTTTNTDMRGTDSAITDLSPIQNVVDDIQKYHMNRRVWDTGTGIITIFEDDGVTARKAFDNIINIDGATIEINPQ